MSFKLGLCVPKGKSARIGFPDRIKDHCKAADIQIVEIDVTKNIEQQGPFRVLLHKVLDYYNEFEAGVAKQKINNLISYASHHKEMIVMDDFDWCFRLTNRKCMIDLIESCEFCFNGIKVFLPRTVKITETMETTDIQIVLKQNGIRFPVVSKFISAYFEDDSRQMCLLFSMESIGKLKKPCLLQEFCNHGGVMYKVFVVGSKFNVCERPSIRDIHANDTNTTLYFDSFRVSKTGYPYIKGIHASDPNERYWANSDEVPNLLDSQVIEGIISRIHNNTGLYLYGFDILIEKDTGNYALIDLNYFPSYSGIGIDHFPDDLIALLKSFKHIPS